VADTESLRSLAREVADLALSLSALSTDGHSCTEALSEVEYLALKILKEASVVRTANVRQIGETRGAWRAVPQPGLLPR